MANNPPIAQADITLFLDKYVTDGKDNIKALLMNMKKLSISDWAHLILSKSFRQVFICKSEIYKKLGNDISIFEELLIHIPLNYIYWRDRSSIGQLLTTTDPNTKLISWDHAFATCIALLKRQIIGSDILTLENVKTDLQKAFRSKECNIDEVLTTISITFSNCIRKRSQSIFSI